MQRERDLKVAQLAAIPVPDWTEQASSQALVGADIATPEPRVTTKRRKLVSYCLDRVLDRRHVIEFMTVVPQQLWQDVRSQWLAETSRERRRHPRNWLLNLERLESRALLAGAPHVMASSNYLENFADIANWSNGFTSGMGTGPWNPVAINANGTIPDGVRTTVQSSTFTTSTAGGIQKGTAQTTPTQSLVFLSTGATANTNSVAVDLALNFTNRAAGTLSFDWAQVSNSTGDRPATLQVYTSLNGTTWTLLSGASVTVTNNVTQSGAVTNVALPSTFNNQSGARLRFYNFNGNGAGSTGSRAKISIDNVAVTSTAIVTAPGAPTINSVTRGNSSLTVAFTAPSFNGGGTITNYEYSLNGGNFQSAGVTESSFTITGLTNGTPYSVVLRAVNSAGSGASSGAVSGTPSTVASAPIIDSITPGNGQLTVAFTPPADNGGAAITNYEFSIDGGVSFNSLSTPSTSSPILITGLTNGTEYAVQLRAVNAAGSGAGSTIVFGTPEAPTTPTVSANALSIPAFSTVYGTASTTFELGVSGASLTGPVTIEVPAAFEISTSSTGVFGSQVTLTPGGAILPVTPVYIRLRATTSAGNHSGNLTITSQDATSVNVPIESSGITPKALTIVGVTANDKIYDTTTLATVSGTPIYDGLVNGDILTMVDLTWVFNSKTVGSKTVTAQGPLDQPSPNYALTAPSLPANITAAPLTVPGAVANNKVFDGTTTATISGAIPNGVLGSDVVTVGGGGTFTSANVGTGIAVTANLTLDGTDGANYSLTQPTGLTADIIKASQTITFNALTPVTTATSTLTLSAAASSGLTVSYASSNTSVATVTGNVLTIVGPGTTVITASQVGNDNYNSATDVPRTLTVTAAFVNYASVGALYQQSFDGLPNSGSTITLAGSGPFFIDANGINAANAEGWQIFRNGGSGSNALFGISDGSGTTFSGAVYSFGTVGQTDRALGGASSGTTAMTWGVAIRNTTGTTLTSFNLAFMQEHWRRNSSATAVAFSYQIGTGVNVGTSTGWTNVAAGNLTPTTTGSATGLDGNISANRTQRNLSVSDINWQSGQELVLRWTQSGTNSNGLAIDDLSFSATSVASPNIAINNKLTNDTKVYDGAAYTPSAAVTGANSTTPTPSFTYYVGVGTNGTNLGSTPPIDVGTYTVVAETAANSSNNSASTSYTYSITPKTLTVSATASNKTYDGNTSASVNLLLAGVVSVSSVVDDVVASGTGVFIDRNAGTVKTVNVSGIVLSGADSGNYTVASTASTTADILAKPLTVTADAKTKVAGTTDPALTYSTVGLVDGDSATGSLTRDAGEAVGTYPITQGTLSFGSNYDVTYQGANLTITQAPATLSEVAINEGIVFTNNNQRSNVISLTVKFSSPVTVGPNAFTLENIGLITPSSSFVPQSQIIYTPGTASSFLLTFATGTGVDARSGGSSGTALGNSLKDGNYKLTIDPTKVTNAGGNLAGTNEFGARAVDRFFRLFGDGDGDGDVDGVDLIAFRRAQLLAPSASNPYNGAYDFNGNNVTFNDTVDRTAYAANQNKIRRVF